MAACGTPAQPTQVAQPTTAPSTGGETTTGPNLVGEQILRLTQGGSVFDLDPGIGNHFWIPQFTMFEGLVRWAQDGTIEPARAESWDVSDDGLVYTFHLRPDGKWSNGDQLTAEDFVWTWKRNIDPNRGGFSYDFVLQPIKNVNGILAGTIPLDDIGAVALDDLTFQVTLEKPASHFLAVMPEPMAAPLHRATLEAHPDDWKTPENWVATGGFVLKEYVENSHLHLKKNPNYRGPGPYLEEIHYAIGGDSLLMYENDEAYFAGPGGELQRVREDPTLSQELHEAASKTLHFYYIKQHQEELRDVNVRRALAMAIDRETFATVVSNDTVAPNGGFLPLTTFYFDPNIQVQFDPVQAKALLAEAGYPDGEGLPTLTIIHWYDDLTVEFVKQQLETNLGLTVQIDRVEVGLATSRSFDPDNLASLQPQGWGASYDDPYGWYGGGIFASNPGNWYAMPPHWLTPDELREYNQLVANIDAASDKTAAIQEMNTWQAAHTPDWANEMFALAEQAAAIADPEAKRPIWSQVQQLMFDNMPVIPIHTSRSFVLVKPYVKNMMVHPTYPNLAAYMNETYIDRSGA
jgi:ABC-type transport system substrate-binding protein